MIVLADNSEPYKSGPIGLAVILVLVIACYFLFRSMSRHLKKIREDFPGEQPPPGAARMTAATAPVSRAPAADVPDTAAPMIEAGGDAGAAGPEPEHHAAAGSAESDG